MDGCSTFFCGGPEPWICTTAFLQLHAYYSISKAPCELQRFYSSMYFHNEALSLYGRYSWNASKENGGEKIIFACVDGPSESSNYRLNCWTRVDLENCKSGTKGYSMKWQEFQSIEIVMDYDYKSKTQRRRAVHSGNWVSQDEHTILAVSLGPFHLLNRLTTQHDILTIILHQTGCWK